MPAYSVTFTSRWTLVVALLIAFVCVCTATESEGTCATSGGSSVPGSTCVFPFTYRGVAYNSCTYEDSQWAWCATDAVLTGSTGYWGYCCCDGVGVCDGIVASVTEEIASELSGISSSIALDHLLEVAGLSRFAVSLMWLSFALNGATILMMGLYIWRQPSANREISALLLCVPVISAISYFGLINGVGVTYVRRIENVWVWNGDLGNVDSSVAASLLGPLSPMFTSRPLICAISNLVSVQVLALLSGVSDGWKNVAQFCILGAGICGYMSMCVLTPAKWGLWMFRYIFTVTAVYVVSGPMSMSARARGCLRSYIFMAIVLALCWMLYPLIYLLGEGAHILSASVGVSLHAIVDVVRIQIFIVLCLRSKALQQYMPLLSMPSSPLEEEDSL